MPLREIHEVLAGGVGADRRFFAQSNWGQKRYCIVTGATHPVFKLVRFVVGPDDQIVPDIRAALPGRGMWLSADRNSVKTAHARRIFSRVARQTVSVADDLADQVEDLLVQRCVDLIGLARRGGQSICGFERVRGWLEEGCVGNLVVASDCVASGLEKTAFKQADVPLIRVLRAEEIGQAFGRQQAVFAALKGGNLAWKFVIEALRLEGFRGLATDV